MSRNKQIYISILITLILCIWTKYLNAMFFKLETFKFSNFKNLLKLIENKDILYKSSKNNIFVLNILPTMEPLSNSLNNNNLRSIKISIFNNSLLTFNKLSTVDNFNYFDKNNWKIILNKELFIESFTQFYFCKFNYILDFSENKKKINTQTSQINFKFVLKSESNRCNYNINTTISYQNYTNIIEHNNYLYINWILNIFSLWCLNIFYKLIKFKLRNGKYYSLFFLIMLSTSFLIDFTHYFNCLISFNDNKIWHIILYLISFYSFIFILYKIIIFKIKYEIIKLKRRGFWLIDIKKYMLKIYIKNYLLYLMIIFLGLNNYGNKYYFMIYFSLFFLQNYKLWNINKYYTTDQKLIFIIYLTKIYNLYYWNLNINNFFLKNLDINCFYVCFTFIFFQSILLSFQILFGGNFIKGLKNNNSVGKYFYNKKNISDKILCAPCSICFTDLKDDLIEYDVKLLNTDFIKDVYNKKNLFIFKTNCEHYFHVSCMLINLTFKNNCPICRTIIDDIPI